MSSAAQRPRLLLQLQRSDFTNVDLATWQLESDSGVDSSIDEAVAVLNVYRPEGVDVPDPARIFGSGLVSWLRADDNPSGGASWPNRVLGQSAFALQTGAPVAALIGGQPALYFDGASYLANPLALSVPGGGRPCVLHFVQMTHVPDDVGAGAFNILGGVGLTGTDLQVSDQSVYCSMYTSANFAGSQNVCGGSPDFPGAFQFDAKPTALGAPVLIGAQLDFSRVQVFGAEFVPAEATFPPDLPASAPWTCAWLGSVGNSFFADYTGLVAEQLILADQLSDAQLAQVCNYFASRYGSVAP
jgi:hypothetical protein